MFLCSSAVLDALTFAVELLLVGVLLDHVSLLLGIRDVSSCLHAYRVDWFRKRQRQNSVSCSARALPWS